MEMNPKKLLSVYHKLFKYCKESEKVSRAEQGKLDEEAKKQSWEEGNVILYFVTCEKFIWNVKHNDWQVSCVGFDIGW